MVVRMEQEDDVERLFSWLKSATVTYREFPGEREIADSVAGWPQPGAGPAVARRDFEHRRGSGYDGNGHGPVAELARTQRMRSMLPDPRGRLRTSPMLGSAFARRG